MLYIITALIVVFDQFIKHIIINSFIYGESTPLIKGFLYLTYVKNTGGAFGIFQHKTKIFIIISLAIIIIYFIFLRKFINDSLVLKISSGFIFGGAIGNLIDRIRLGYVVDYLDVRFWPVFNLADSMIVLGAGLLIIYLIFSEFKNSG